MKMCQENTYWNNNGRFNAEYNEMRKSGFEFTQAELSIFYKYHRYYNDGDMPYGTKYAWAEDIEKWLENQADIAVAKAYKRFKNSEVTNLIKYFAKKSFKSFNSWINQ